MYIHIGDEVVISTDELIGILHIPTKRARGKQQLEFPKGAVEQLRKEENVKSCVITKSGIHYSSISAVTLKRRISEESYTSKERG